MKWLLPAMAMALTLISCTPTTPQARIAANPGRFAKLPEKEKALVEQGRIDRGMSMAGVSLAWGDPSQRYEGSRGGKMTERWIYTTLEPTYASGFYGGWGYGGWGYGRYGRYGWDGYGIGISPRLEYMPEERASVLFVNGRVDNWERRR